MCSAHVAIIRECNGRIPYCEVMHSSDEYVHVRMLGGGDSSRHSLTSSYPAMSASHHIAQTDTAHTLVILPSGLE